MKKFEFSVLIVKTKCIVSTQLGAVHQRRPHSGGEGGNRFADKGEEGISGMRTSVFQLFPRRKIADCSIPFSVFRASVNHA